MQAIQHLRHSSHRPKCYTMFLRASLKHNRDTAWLEMSSAQLEPASDRVLRDYWNFCPLPQDCLRLACVPCFSIFSLAAEPCGDNTTHRIEGTPREKMKQRHREGTGHTAWSGDVIYPIESNHCMSAFRPDLGST